MSGGATSSLLGDGKGAPVDNIPRVEFDLEPSIAAMLDRKMANRSRPAYEIVSVIEVADRLRHFFSTEVPGSRVEHVHRMSGGASKEQFRFTLLDAGAHDGAYVLRMDPFQGVVETDRTREFEVVRAMEGLVPVPRMSWLDASGQRLGRPSVIMTFSNGVIRPTHSHAGNVTGVGLVFGKRWRHILSEQFIQSLSKIHNFDWRVNQLPSLQAPRDDPYQAARWQVNWWSRVWREDRVSSVPLTGLVECWLLENVPACHDPVLLHGDYRSGNYLFDETSEAITAVLDWELAHIGDHHEDLAWILQSGSTDGDVFYASGLMIKSELMTCYTRATGREVDPETLHFYQVLGAFKCFVIVMGTGLRAARNSHSHQDILLTWMSTIGHAFASELCRLLEEDTFS